jgi:transcriptional/translational regulatory protein YebC/TACO1
MAKTLFTVHSVRLDKNNDVGFVFPSKGKAQFDPNEDMDNDVLQDMATNNLLLIHPDNCYIGHHGDDFAVVDNSNDNVVLMLVKADPTIHDEH